MRRLRLLCLVVGLVACSSSTVVDMPPVVHAGLDVDTVIPSVLVLGATATSDHSTINHFDWTVVTAPDLTQVTAVAKGDPPGSTVELYTGDVTGLYVLGVTATDATGRVSEPDYVNLMLRPKPPTLEVQLTCASGCETVDTALEANEGATLALEAQVNHPERVVGYRWSFELVRDSLDPFVGALATQTNGARATVVLPQVAKAARLEVSVTALGEASATASLGVGERNSIEGPP